MLVWCGIVLRGAMLVKLVRCGETCEMRGVAILLLVRVLHVVGVVLIAMRVVLVVRLVLLVRVLVGGGAGA